MDKLKIPLKALIRGTSNLCNCDSRHPRGNDFGELLSMKGLPVTALRYGGALFSTSIMRIQLGPLKCSGKVGIYPTELEMEEKRALEKRLNILNETLIQQTKIITNITTTISLLSSGYKTVKSDFGMVVYKLYKDTKSRSDALSTCTGDASFLHFPQPSNKQENLFYYNLIYPSINHGSYIDGGSAIWLDTSKSISWSNWREGVPSSSGNPYTSMMFKTGERDKNWNRVGIRHVYYFVCTAVFI